MSALTTTFEGDPLHTITFREQRIWLAGQVGAALEYSHDGHRLVRNIRSRWADEVRLGEHYDVLSGTELHALRESVGTEVVPAKCRSMVVLYESGLHLVLLLTKKRRGKQLRQHFANEVMPQLARDGQYSPKRQVEGDAIVDRDLKPANSNELRFRELDIESERIANERERIRLQFAQLRIDTMERAITHHPSLAPESAAALRASCVEMVTGSEQNLLKPVIGNGWKSPTEMAKQWELTPNRIGRTISALAQEGIVLKANAEMSKQIMSKSQSSDRNVQPYVYSPHAEAIIYAKLQELGHVPKDAA